MILLLLTTEAEVLLDVWLSKVVKLEQSIKDNRRILGDGGGQDNTASRGKVCSSFRSGLQQGP